MGQRSKSVPIDVYKAENVLIERGMNKHTVANAMGHGDSWFTDCIRLRRMTKSDVLLFQQLYGVNLEISMPIEVPEKVKADIVEVSSPIDYDRLYDIIYKAVREGVKSALG